jgi:hypothetical protein
MSDIADLRRLEEIVARLTGEKALRDEAKDIVRRLITGSDTAAWWADHGPERPLPPAPRSLVDYVVVNGQASVSEIAATLDIEEEYARRLVSRADTALLERGGKATISISGGIVRTAATSIVVSSLRPGRT